MDSVKLNSEQGEDGCHHPTPPPQKNMTKSCENTSKGKEISNLVYVRWEAQDQLPPPQTYMLSPRILIISILQMGKLRL